MYLLVPLSVVLVFVIAVIFWWSLRNGQFEDLEGPGYRVLMDDDNMGNTKPDPVAEKTSRSDSIA
jgi:cbb3-type cytochrome oxidase maturation protein